MFGWLRNAFASHRRQVQARAMLDAFNRAVLARYDAAQTTGENRKHWAAADGLSAAAANSPAVRRTLRNRARYECANNCYANGMVRTLAYHAIGTGPSLQVQTGDKATNQLIEREWRRWSRSINLAGKLRTMREARARDGESFAIMTTNRQLAGPVKLTLRLVEADQFATADATGATLAPNYVDGITYDDDGNPLTYEMLAAHPGDAWQSTFGKGRTLKARDVCHLFREDRPGQARGIPEITPALPLYAILRRYTLATLTASEIAAMLAVFLKTTGPAVTPDDIDGGTWQSLDLNRGAMTILPEGWETEQFDAKQPVTQYDSFVRAVIREIARCLDMPFNVAAGDSSDYNYASGRLDHQTYKRSIDIDRDAVTLAVLDRLFDEWLQEAALQPGLFPSLSLFGAIDREWHWTPFEHVDPLKEANAHAVRLSNGLAAIPTYFASQGLDWEVELEKQASALGMSLDEYRRRLADKLLGPQGEQVTRSARDVAAALADVRQSVEDLASAL